MLLYIKETIPAYDVGIQLKEEADCNEAIWCELVKDIQQLPLE